MATACGLPPPYECAFADFPDTVFDANEFADCCDFLLADDSPAELEELNSRAQRRRTSTCDIDAVVDGATGRLSCDLPRPPRSSLDGKKPAAARCISFDVPRSQLAPVSESPARKGTGVISWLAAWGKLAEEQGCSVLETSPSTGSQPVRSCMSLPPPGPGAALATSSAFYSSGASVKPQSPFHSASLLAPQAQQPQQHHAWASESSDNGSGYSPLQSSVSARSIRSIDAQSNWSSPEGHAARRRSLSMGPGAAHPAAARASMDGWSDAGCYAALAVETQNKRKREAAAAAAMTAQQTTAAHGCGASLSCDPLGFGAQHTIAAQQQPARRRSSQQYCVRGSVDGSLYSASGTLSGSPPPMPFNRAAVSLDLPRRSTPQRNGSPDFLGASIGRATAYPAPIQEAQAPCVFSMAAWDAALPLDLLQGDAAADGELAAVLAGPSLPTAEFWIPSF